MESYITWKELDNIKIFLENYINKKGANLSDWMTGDVFVGYKTMFDYKNDKYYLYVSTKKMRMIGIEVRTQDNILCNTLVKYDCDYQTNLSKLLDTSVFYLR